MRHLLPLVLAALLSACSRSAPADDSASPDSEVATPRASPSPDPATASTTTPAAAVEPVTASFRAWEGACDNTRTCTLFGFPGVDDFGMAGAEGWGFIRLERAAGGEADVAVTLAAGESSGEAKPLPMRAAVDGGPTFPLRTEGGNAPYHLARLSGAEARALVAALRNGRALTITVQGTAPGVVSLDGAAAALLWMDDQQGRVGTRTALARPGERPAAAVPAAPALPVVRAVKPLGGAVAASPALLARPEVAACLSEQMEGMDNTVTGTRLTPARVLWEVPCGSGAYNFTTAFFFGEAATGALRPVPLTPYTGEGDEPAHHAVNAGFDAATGRIEAFAKGRGIGDCGTAQTWVWDGVAFVLTDELSMGRCAGVWADDWPVLRRATVR